MLSAAEHGSSSLALPHNELWDMVVLGRYKQPPLRFKGQRIAHLRRAFEPDVDLFIDVWARRKGGDVVSYNGFAVSSLQAYADVVACVEDVGIHLETVCARKLDTLQVADIGKIVSVALRYHAFHQEFAVLVGDFLAMFDSYCTRWSQQ